MAGGGLRGCARWGGASLTGVGVPRDPAAAGAPRRAQGPCSLRRASRHRSRSASVPHPSPLSCCLQSPRPAGPARCSALAALRAGFLFFLFSPPLPNLSDPDTSWPKATAMLQGHMGISPTTGSLTTPLHLQSPPPPRVPGIQPPHCALAPFSALPGARPPSSLETLPKYRISEAFPRRPHGLRLAFPGAPTAPGPPLSCTTLATGPSCPCKDLPPLPDSLPLEDAAELLFSLAPERSPGPRQASTHVFRNE